MILATDIYNEVSKLIRKDGRSGYFSYDDFNQWSPIIESVLMNYYCQALEESSEVVESLKPFLKEVDLSIINAQTINETGYVTFPSDYRRFVDVAYKYYANPVTYGAEVTRKTVQADYYHTKEWYDMYDSAIRKPSLAKNKVRFRIINNTLEISERYGNVALVYIANPIYANISYTVNVSTDEQVATTSINFQWTEKDRTNLIDLFCLYLGMSIRETPLIQFAQLKKKVD